MYHVQTISNVDIFVIVTCNSLSKVSELWEIWVVFVKIT